MIVESVNGRFYRNPTVIHKTWYLTVDEMGAFVKRKGKITWPTARKPLRAAGINCVIESEYGHGKAILHNAYTTVTLFKVRLRAPIPVPQAFEAELHFKPSERELNGEKLLTWT